MTTFLTFLLAYGVYAGVLLAAAGLYALLHWALARDPLERVFGDELDEVRRLPEAHR